MATSYCRWPVAAAAALREAAREARGERRVPLGGSSEDRQDLEVEAFTVYGREAGGSTRS